MSVKHGVPQASIIGPILFLLFVNDLPLYVSNSDIDIYADDATLSYSSSWNNDRLSMEKYISKDLENIGNWAKRNKMVISETKTKSMPLTGNV